VCLAETHCPIPRCRCWVQEASAPLAG
jgi:hypothetical protein